MYYHVIAETKNIGKEKSEVYSAFDITDKNRLIEQYVKPYMMDEDFVIDGYSVRRTELKRFYVSESQTNSKQLVDKFREKIRGSGILVPMSRKGIVQDNNYSKDITIEIQNSVKDMINSKSDIEYKEQQEVSNDIFIVHGRNTSVKNDIARFIEKIGLSAIILHEQPNLSATIIEKFEKFADVRYAIILYTADDIGALAGEKEMKPRARQNVLFEHGYFISKLGRKNVCAVVEENVEIPSDLSGILFIPYDKDGLWKYKIAKEMKAAGINVDMNKL